MTAGSRRPPGDGFLSRSQVARENAPQVSRISIPPGSTRIGPMRATFYLAAFVAGAIGVEIIGVAVGTTGVPDAFVAVIGTGAAAPVALLAGLSNCSCSVDVRSRLCARMV